MPYKVERGKVSFQCRTLSQKRLQVQHLVLRQKLLPQIGLKKGTKTNLMKQPNSSSNFQPNQILIKIKMKSNLKKKKVRERERERELKLNDLHQTKHLTLKRSKQFVLGFNLQKEIKFQLITTAITNIRKQHKVNDFHQAK